MKKHKKLQPKEPVDELSNRDKFELALLLLICAFAVAMIIAFIIATVQAVAEGVL